MKMYNIRGNRNSSGSTSEKGYKSPSKRKHGVIPGGSSVTNRRKTGKKSISSKNKKFLEGLGLKVKQSVENC